jgi:hypothetical protein
LDVPTYKDLKNKNNSYRDALNKDAALILEQIHASTPHTFEPFSLSIKTGRPRIWYLMISEFLKGSTRYQMLPANFFKCFRSKNTVFEPAQIINYSSNILNSPLVPVQSAQEIE